MRLLPVFIAAAPTSMVATVNTSPAVVKLTRLHARSRAQARSVGARPGSASRSSHGRFRVFHDALEQRGGLIVRVERGGGGSRGEQTVREARDDEAAHVVRNEVAASAHQRVRARRAEQTDRAARA